MTIYGVEAPMEQATAMGDVLVGAGEQIANALRALRTGTAIAPHLVEIHRLENEGDRHLPRRHRVALRQRHRPDGRDPLEGLFESLEASVDACEKVAHVLEGITLKAH